MGSYNFGINPRTITKSSAIKGRLGLKTPWYADDEKFQQQFEQRQEESKFLVNVLLRHGIDLRRQKLTGIWSLDGAEDIIKRYKQHLFLPCAASVIRGNEARHLACWSQIATSNQVRHIRILNKADDGEDFLENVDRSKSKINIPGTWGTYKQNLRYGVFSSGPRSGVSPEEFAMHSKNLVRKINEFDKLPGVSVQYWSIEFTILDHGGTFSLNIHANVIYTLHKEFEFGFREKVKREITPNEYWHDSGVIEPKDVSKVACYVNKYKQKVKKDDDVDVKDGHSLDGQIIGLVELARRNEEALVELYKSTFRLRLSGVKNEYRQFKKFLESWGVRVVVDRDRLRGREFVFKQHNKRLTVEEHRAREQAKIEKAEQERSHKIYQKEQKLQKIGAVKEDAKTELKRVKELYKKQYEDLRREKWAAVPKKNKDDAAMSLKRFYDAKIKDLLSERDDRIFEIKKDRDNKINEIEDEIQREKERLAAEKKRKKAAPPVERTNYLVRVSDIKKRKDKNAYDVQLEVEGFDEELLHNPKTDFDRENSEKILNVWAHYAEIARNNGWSEELQENTCQIEEASPLKIEALWNSYLSKHRGLYRKRDFKIELQNVIACYYDPTDWCDYELPEIENQELRNFIYDLTDYDKNLDDNLVKFLHTGFLYSRLTSFLLISATHAGNCRKLNMWDENNFFEVYPFGLLPDEDAPIELTEGPDNDKIWKKWFKSHPDFVVDLRY